MKNYNYLIGIDGGGTKTRALITDGSYEVLADFCAGPSNMQICGCDLSAHVILDLVEKCRRRVRADANQISAICCGLAGVGRDADKRRMMAALKKKATGFGYSPRCICVESDARIALEGAFRGEPGIILVAGTGSIAFGRDYDGNFHRAGGWGRFLNDAGSGYAIGKEAVRSVAAYIDGLGPDTILVRELCDNFGLKDQGTIIDAVYRKAFDFALVAPTVIHGAESGDAVCRTIINHAADSLCLYAGTIATRMQSAGYTGGIPLVFRGGLIENDNALSQALRMKIQERLCSVEIVDALCSPAFGAVLLAGAKVKIRSVH